MKYKYNCFTASKIAFPLIILSSLPAAVFAKDDIKLGSDGSLELSITANRRLQELNQSLAAVTVITKKEIENTQATNISEVLIGSAVLAIAVCDIISSGGFYFFSGRFSDVNLSEFADRLATYMPMFMKTTLLYLGIAAVIHLAFVQAGKFSGKLYHRSY